MLGFISRKIGVKISLLVNALILVIMLAGTYFLVTQQTKSLEAELFYQGKNKSILGAEMIGTIIEEAIDNGVISVNEAFDTDYKVFGNFDPPKYHTKYDFYLDRAILGPQDTFLLDEDLIYAVAVDRNGYVPTHNTRYQQPITGDPEVDRVQNRTKGIFNDPVGLKAAQNQEPGYRQIYYRDTGEVAWEFDSPIFVKGKHWGGFRVGLSLESVAAAKHELVKNMGIIMGAILLASLVLTFIFVNRAMDPLRRLAATAGELAEGKNLQTEISVQRKDEIGALQNALNRLRLSMMIALKRKG